MILYVLILMPIVLGLCLYLFHNRKPILTLLVQLGLTCLSFYVFYTLDISHTQPYIHALSGYPKGLGISLRVDPISGLMIFITTLLFLILLCFDLYADYTNALFHFLFLSLEGLIIAMFMAQDLFTLFALIEVSAILVSLLILFKKEHRNMYDGLVYLILNTVAMSFFLFGIGYLYRLFGTLSLELLKDLIPMISDKRSLILPSTLMFTGIGFKIALVPTFGWVPRAYGRHGAPTLVYAVMSGLYIKASLYVFINLLSLFGGPLGLKSFFLLVGLLTGISGLIFAFFQYDLQLFLAYSTVSQLGLIVIGLSGSSQESYYGSIYHILVHSLFKVTLFIIIGLIMNTYGTRDIRQIRGLLKASPYLTMIIFLLMLGITGAPFFNGSLSKYLIQEGLNQDLAFFLMTLLNIGTLAYTFKWVPMILGLTSFKLSIKPHQKILLGLLCCISLISGFLGHTFVNQFFSLRIEWTLGDYINKSITYLVTIILGYLLYHFGSGRIRIFELANRLELSFNELLFSLVSFFMILLVYLSILVH